MMLPFSRHVIQKKEVAWSCQIITRGHNTEDHDVNFHLRGNFNSHIRHFNIFSFPILVTAACIETKASSLLRASSGCWDISVSVAIRLRARRSKFFPQKVWEFFSSPPRSDQIRGEICLVSNGNRVFFPRG